MITRGRLVGQTPEPGLSETTPERFSYASPTAIPTRSVSFDVAHFRFCGEGGGQQISPGNRIGGSRHRRGGHAATARRSARVSRPRRLARPTGLLRSLKPQVSEVFVLAKLTPNEGDLSVKHLGGVRETRAQRGRVPGWRTTKELRNFKKRKRGDCQGGILAYACFLL
jgi:hypothetical protein